MSLCLLLLGVLVGCADAGAPRAPGPAPAPVGASPATPAVQAGGGGDAWVGEDKLRHFTLSFGVTTMGYGVARLGLAPEPALPVAGAVALGLGLAKEVVDRRGHGHFSGKDLAWDAAGVALGLAFAHHIR